MRWKDLRLSFKFAIGFGVVLVLLTVVGVWSIVGIRSISGATAASDHKTTRGAPVDAKDGEFEVF